MKGQMKVEFIFSLVVFSVIIFYMATQISDYTRDSIMESNRQIALEKAENVLHWLVMQGGENNWESDPLNAKRIGLAYSPYNLSIEKIKALNNTRINNFCVLMDGFNLGGYRLTIYNSTNNLLFCGSVGYVNIMVSSTKKVFINGDTGNITLVLFS